MLKYILDIYVLDKLFVELQKTGSNFDMLVLNYMLHL